MYFGTLISFKKEGSAGKRHQSMNRTFTDKTSPSTTLKMNPLIVGTLLLSSVLSINAGVVRRDAPLGSYGLGPVPQASAQVFTTTGFGGSPSFGGSSSFNGGVAATSPLVSLPVVAIISETNNAPGTLGDNSDFSNSFEADNGIKQQSSGSTVVVGEDAVVVMKGSYEYIGDDGQTYVVDWIADENGFQPSAAHLPKDVPIPFPEIAAAVEAQIAFAAQEDAAGGSSVGGFGGSSSQGGFQGSSSGSFGSSSQGGFQGSSSGFSGSFQPQSNGFSGGQSFGASNQVQSLTNYGF